MRIIVKGEQPTTGTVHYAVRAKADRRDGYQHLFPTCGKGNIRHSLSEVPADTKVTCKRCLASRPEQTAGL